MRTRWQPAKWLGTKKPWPVYEIVVVMRCLEQGAACRPAKRLGTPGFQWAAAFGTVVESAAERSQVPGTRHRYLPAKRLDR